jgi:hypothetical protein
MRRLRSLLVEIHPPNLSTTGLEAAPADLGAPSAARGVTPEQAERRRAEGHLGLDLLRDRARDLGGRLEVDSEPGRGTTVTLEVGAR